MISRQKVEMLIRTIQTESNPMQPVPNSRAVDLACKPSIRLYSDKYQQRVFVSISSFYAQASTIERLDKVLKLAVGFGFFCGLLVDRCMAGLGNSYVRVGT